MSQSFFPQASNFSIHGQANNFITGNQTNTTTNNYITVPELDSNSFPEAKPVHDEYHIRRGDIRIFHKVFSQDVDITSAQRWNNEPGKALAFKRTVHRANIIGRRDVLEFVAVSYSGRDGDTAWERDFIFFSNHHPHIAHLFGVNLSLRTLIFCNDIVPVKDLWERSSAIIKCYITHRASRDTHNIAAETNILSLMKDDFDLHNINWISIQPSGFACFAPPQTKSFGDDRDFVTSAGKWNVDELEPLPLKFYLGSDESALNFLLQWPVLSMEMSQELAFHVLIARSSSGTQTFYCEYPNLLTLPTSLPSIISGSPRRPIGQFKNTNISLGSRSCTTKISPWVGNWKLKTGFYRGEDIPHITVANGFTRISSTDYWQLCGVKKLSSPVLSLTLGVSKKDQEIFNIAWLSQASYCSSFSDTPTHLIQSIVLQLAPGNEKLLFPHNTQVYLFIAPVVVSNSPEVSAITVNWGENGESVYYWSFDPDGSRQISARVAEALGLAQLVKRINPLNMDDLQDHQYEAAIQLQSQRGYDPMTQGFAKRHELPLVEIVQPLSNIQDENEDGEMWYDAQESPIPDWNGTFLLSSAFFYHLEQNAFPGCSGAGCKLRVKKFLAAPWLYGFLPENHLNRWVGIFPVWNGEDIGSLQWEEHQHVHYVESSAAHRKRRASFS
ncbi:hypothetical protein VKT23_014688 [Stygiomarasmius scandens]|uniref:Uncharacterized protein n=1 Tax=Marasmiellus scandens TaxID=2682957 RepID=A0ABR1J0W3_9AGAR